MAETDVKEKKVRILGETTSFEEVKNDSTKSQTIDIGAKVEKSSEKTTLDFMNSGFVNEFVGKQTKKSDDANTVKDNFEGKTTEQVRDEIRNKEESKEDWTPKDFEMIAGFIITMIDALVASSLRWWSKDTSDQAYSLSKDKQDKLTKQLAMILIKHQAKFRVEIIFFLSIVMFYVGPFMKAKERRKLVKEAEQKEAAEKFAEAESIANQVFEQEEKIRKEGKVNNNENTEVINPVILETNEIINRPTLKRRRGKQPK